jgi:hypothetical protein
VAKHVGGSLVVAPRPWTGKAWLKLPLGSVHGFSG